MLSLKETRRSVGAVSANFGVNLVGDKARKKAREVEAINGNEEDLRERIEQEFMYGTDLTFPTPGYEYRVDLGTYAKYYLLRGDDA